jgi:hypothetical protein
MNEESPAASPGPDGESRTRFDRVLATRGSKIAAIIGGAFLAAVGGVIATRLIAFGEKSAKHVFGGPSAPLTWHLLPRGYLAERTAVPPYYIIPNAQARGPGALNEGERRAVVADGPEWSAWAREHGGVDGSSQIVLVELRARTDEPVTVTGIEVTIRDRKPPVKGWYSVRMPAGDVVPIRRATIDLDTPTATVRYHKDYRDLAGTDHLVLSVSRSKPEDIQLEANTDEALVEWKAKVLYSGADGTGSVVVDDNGQPFRVSSEIGSAGYVSGDVAGRLHRVQCWDRKGVATLC